MNHNQSVEVRSRSDSLSSSDTVSLPLYDFAEVRKLLYDCNGTNGSGIKLSANKLSALVDGIDNLVESRGNAIYSDDAGKYSELQCKIQLGDYAGCMYNTLKKKTSMKWSSAEEVHKDLNSEDDRTKDST